MIRKETQDVITDIIHTFSGIDGGVKYFKFKTVIAIFDKQAAEGDKESIEIIKSIKKFNILLNACEELFDKQDDKKEKEKNDLQSNPISK